MVLTEEFSGWLDSARRIDLLCLDTDASLVVIELKRDADGGHMDLQAIRYAAMVSSMTFDQAVQTLAAFENACTPNQDAARDKILDFLGWDAPQEEIFGLDTRIILASADFSKEITTSVLWLRERGIDITCTRLKPYKLDDGRLLIDIQPLIPLPEAQDFITSLGNKRLAQRSERAERHDLRVTFLLALLERAAGRSPAHIGRRPSDTGALPGAIGRSGFSINYVTAQNETRIELLITAEDAKLQFRRLAEHKEDIEKAFGGELIWLEKPETRQCRIFQSVPGGYRSPETDWADIHERLIAAMARLDVAVRPWVLRLP